MTIENEQRWIYLGKLCNQKPSVIFKISDLAPHDSNSSSSLPLFAAYQSAAATTVSRAMIGISVETEASIDALTPAQQSQTPENLASSIEFAQKMLQNFYNYASSFAKDAPDGQSYVPFATLQTWFDNFKRRLDNNPNFWKNL